MFFCFSSFSPDSVSCTCVRTSFMRCLSKKATPLKKGKRKEKWKEDTGLKFASFKSRLSEKKKDIQTLYKIGANESQITKIFFKHGLYLSYSGGFIGLVLGCLIVFLQEQFNLILLSGTSIPYPVTFDFNNFLIVIGWLLVVGAGGSFVSSIALKKIKL